MDKPRILVVDDEPRAVELLVRSLRRIGRIETAASGDEAWQRFAPAAFELVVSDQRMPGMSGVELLGKIACQDENVGRILLTGYSDMDATVDAINHGRVHAYLHKPCAPPDLEASVRGVLDRVNLARENRRLVSVTVEQNHELETVRDELQVSQEQLEQARCLAAIGKAIATVVHDIRGPLSVIEGLAQAPPDDVAALRESILQEARHLNGMCEELLEISRVSGQEGELAEVDLDELVQAAVAPYLELASRSGVQLDLPAPTGASFRGNTDRLTRALRNLVQNAIEAMPDGGRIDLSCQQDADATLHLRLADSGPGIAAAIRERIFEPFYTAGKANGNGLGLAIVKLVIDQHHGRIRLEKSELGGACFAIELPGLASGG